MELRKIKYKLKFVNEGKEFELPKMTVKMHEDALNLISKDKDKMHEDVYNASMTRYVVAVALNRVDASKTPIQYVDLVGDMHPDDLLKLFGNIWASGRTEDKSDRKFRKKNNISKRGFR